MPEETDNSCKISRWQMLKAQLNNLSPAAFRQKIGEAQDAILIDVRTPTEFIEGHIDGALNINYLSESFWEEVEQLPSDKTYLIYCRSSRRSIRVCTLMKNGGFDPKRIFNMDGGYLEWCKQFAHQP